MQLFWGIVASNALVVMVLAAAVALLGRVWRNPQCLHLLWLLVLLKLVTPPALTVPLPVVPACRVAKERRPAEAGDRESPTVASSPEAGALLTTRSAPAESPGGAPTSASENRTIAAAPASESATTSTAEAPANAAATLATPSPTPADRIPWLAVLAWIWGLGVVVFACRCAWRIAAFQRLLRAAEATSPAVTAMADRVAARLGLRRTPEIRTLPVCISPLVWSLGGRARVYLPAALVERLGAAAQEAILTHEFAHVRRRDHWVRLFDVVMVTLFWWHPVVWWASRRLHELEEQCADAMVVGAAPDAAGTYAAALVDTLEFLSQRPVAVPLAAAAARSSTFLERRIRMLKHYTGQMRLTAGRAIVLFVVAAIPMAVAFAAVPRESEEPAEASATTTENQGDQPAVERRTVDRPASDFPEKVDLSTPESAVAACCRISVTDPKFPKELWPWKFNTKLIEWSRREEEQNPEEFTKNRRAYRSARILEVLTWRGDLAGVIAKIKPAEGDGRGAYRFWTLGCVDGVWKIFGESVAASVEAARDIFDRDKEKQWQTYEKARDAIRRGELLPMPGMVELSGAEEKEIDRWRNETWGLSIDLDMPTLAPQAVQWTFLNEDPVPAFIAQVRRMRSFNENRLAQASDEARREQLRNIDMKVSWDLGFRKVTGDNLWLLTEQPGGQSASHGLSSNGPAGRKWLATKTVDINGKPVCWCIPVEVKKGKSVNVTFCESNTFDLAAAYQRAMEEPAEKDETARARTLVERFFDNNFREVTSRKDVEWGEVTKEPGGNVSIRYKYKARIWDKETKVFERVFTFDAEGNFVGVKNVGKK